MKTEKKVRKPRTRKPKDAVAPVVNLEAVVPALTTENTDVSTVTKEDETTNVNDAAAALSEPAAAIEKPVATLEKFAMSIVQKQDGHEVFRTSMNFELNEQQAKQPDYIIGTALYSLFSELELAKQFKTRFFDSRLPLELKIESQHVSINLGTIRKEFMAKMKLNNGERSNLAFVQYAIAAANHAFKPVVVMKATTLLAEKVIDASLKYNKPAKQSIAHSQLTRLANTVLVPDAEAEAPKN